MSRRSVIAGLILSLPFSCCLLTSGWAGNTLRGDAELFYVDYDAKVGGKGVFSGNSLVQRYSLEYAVTNLVQRSQPRYYNLTLGYDWVDFDTKATDLDQKTEISGWLSRFRYSGEVVYNDLATPFNVRAYANDSQAYALDRNLTHSSLFEDGLISGISTGGKSISSGISVGFEPSRTNNVNLRGLPRMLLDYRESSHKVSELNYRADLKIKELAVAGLNKENNWVHYRTLSYENSLNRSENYRQQKIQLGLIDPVGRRKWSLLTNWIQVSADAQLTTISSPSRERELEAYDVNFMAIATRKTWGARTFMNYERVLNYQSITESARIPVYFKGIYGRDTDWYLNLAASRGREQLFPERTYSNSYSNGFSAGATTLKRSLFTVSPSFQLHMDKAFRSNNDSYALEARLETASTHRFSDRLALAGKINWRSKDDGQNAAESKSWSSAVDLHGTYRAINNITYKLTEQIETGSGGGYIDSNNLRANTGTTGKLLKYLRNYNFASVSWTPTSQFAASINGSFDIVKGTGLPKREEAIVDYRLGYDTSETSIRYDSIYKYFSDGLSVTSHTWENDVEIQYRPDRYNDGLLRVSYDESRSSGVAQSGLGLLQRYTYKIFSSSGVIREIASISEEYSFKGSQSYGISSSSQYLMLTGRYNPTARLSLYGSAKYDTASAGGTILSYRAGMSADFKLLSTTLDYTFARRDFDNRVEKKLAAAVRRSF